MYKVHLFIIISAFLFVSGCGMASSSGSSGITKDLDVGEDDYKKIVSSNNQLGFELLSEVEADGAGNTFISPTSLLMALSMVYNGSDGVTQEEIAKVLHSEGIDKTELNKANASLIEMLHSNSNQIQLDIANSIWLNENFHFQPDFAQKNKDYFNANTQEIDISDSMSPQMINNWVKQSTNDKIEEIVKAPLDPDLVAILINAIYFKGNWKYEFDKKRTVERTFYLENEIIKNVPLMTLTEKLSYLENGDFQAVSLPYGEDEMSMKIFLPKKNASLEEFKKNLTNENWNKWRSAFREKEGTVILPKFQLEYEVVLNEALKKLGMTTAFHKGADFTKMIEENDPLWISKVKQKTFIDVNEEGTEAAAVTSVSVVTESATIDEPFYMEVNRPFFFAITDDKTDTILFMGSIYNPKKGD